MVYCVRAHTVLVGTGRVERDQPCRKREPGVTLQWTTSFRSVFRRTVSTDEEEVGGLVDSCGGRGG